MSPQARAILWAQVRMLRNYLPRSGTAGLIFSFLVPLGWYGMWCLLALVAAKILASSDAATTATIMGGGMVLVFLYWQVVPVLMATTGASLEIKKLRVYPIPHSRLFALEVLLRITTGVETALILAGAFVGLEWNRGVPFWGPPSLLLFVVFNLCVAAGVREILVRVFARKRVREVAAFLLVLCGALPQLVLVTSPHPRWMMGVASYHAWWLPWSAAADAAQGLSPLRSIATLAFWTLAAWIVGRWQFERGLRFDADAARATDAPAAPAARPWSDRLFRWPSLLFPDPLAAMVEKDLRFLARAPRFRLVFTMGFTFGLLIWLPIAGRGGEGVLGHNYLTLVCVYALLLLGDVCFWNVLGFDRRAAQVYFVMPVRFGLVLVAKNISALFWVLLEITAIIAVCSLLRMPVTLARLAEAYAVTLVITLYLVAIGNLTSVYKPRGVNPERSMRANATGQLQALLVLVYPVAGLPVMLAYGARYAFDSPLAFYIVLLLAGLMGAVVYWVAMDSAVERAAEEREAIVARLAQGEGMIQA